jgi:muconolactone D-isomerase
VRPLVSISLGSQAVSEGGVVEFLVTMTTRVPPGTADETVAQVRQREAAHSHDLAERGNLRRLWALAAQPPLRRTLGLWNARDDEEIDTIVKSLPSTRG